MKVVPVTDGDFKATIVSSKLPVLVYFWASWCGPCRALSPRIDALAEEFDGRLTVVKYNVEEENRHAAQLYVKGIPCLILFRDGVEVKRQSGAVPLWQLRNFVAEVLIWSGTTGKDPSVVKMPLIQWPACGASIVKLAFSLIFLAIIAILAGWLYRAC